MEKYHLIIENNRSVDNSDNNFIRNILFLVISLLLIISLVRLVIVGDSTISSFSDFLQNISNLKSIDLSSLRSFRLISDGSDWGLFNFLKDFFNTLSSIAGFGLWLVGGFVNLLFFAFQILDFIFV